jgi:riboflavin kinase/FMN adenylyltransferase
MIYRGLETIPESFRECAVTVGNFDGVHIGHREILRQVIAIAAGSGWTSAAVTFDPHPTKLVAPQRAPRLLTTVEERARLIEQQGIDCALILPFSHEIANLTPEQFVRRVLVDRLHARAVLVGENFRFGHQAAGTWRDLEDLGAKYGFSVQVVSPVFWRRTLISSSEIRRLIESGSVSRACRMLGRPYSLSGSVIPGQGIGSKQTVPTLNLDAQNEVLPRAGVYITRTYEAASSREWPSITNVGYRPTFNGQGLSIETFLLAPLDQATPREIRVELLRWVRPEQKFENAGALRAQIFRDVGRAQAYHRRVRQMLRVSA